MRDTTSRIPQSVRRILEVTILGLLLLLGVEGGRAEIIETDGPASQPLASPRVIVELSTPPLAEAYRTMVNAASVDGRLDVNSTSAQAYVAALQAEQAAFVTSMQAALPGATVGTFINEMGATEAATYQVVMNGIAVDLTGMDQDEAMEKLQHMPGVKVVHPDKPYQTLLYTSTHLINAPVVWNSAAIGGVENAGEGIRVASVDGGVHKDAPMFSGEGYTYPNGYQPNGLGLTSNNNGKIIASRTYFRPWDPPAPGDENPWPGVAGTPHGTHTASTAAGNCVDGVTYAGLTIGSICGVAPRAYVMSYRIFYASVNGNDSSYTVEMLAALEDVVTDGAHIMNNSWGEGPISEGGPFDAIDTALRSATMAGVFVSMSTGNSGPGLGTSDHPSADYINVAASTTSGTLAAGQVSISAPDPVDPDKTNFPFGVANFGPPLPIGQINEYPYIPAVAVAPGNATGCGPFAPNTFDGVAAVISRGACFFTDKFYYAQQAGADFVIVYNNQGEGLINMSCGGNFCNDITVSGLFIGQTNGQKLVDWYNIHGPASRLEFNSIAFQTGNTPDEIIAFSSRGPGVGNILKPDIAAPGVNILAQGYTPSAVGEGRHLGYGQVSGTSMAAPHVAGAGALLRQLHPEWTPANIKSALMSTSKFMDIYTADGQPSQPLDMGAGRLDVAAAMNPGVLLDPPGLSYGLLLTGTQQIISVQVTSIATMTQSYNLSTLYTGDSFTQTTALPGFSVSPITLDLAPGETEVISVTFDPASGSGYGDNQGYILLTGSEYQAHLPAWARVTYAQPLADILIIDNDFSNELGLPDYLDYYTNALDELGYTYNVVDTGERVVQPTTIPDAATLAAYRAIILYTGENFFADGDFTVSTGLTTLDQDRLVEYLNSGGSMIAMGQDLSAALDADEVDADVGNRNFLYVYRFGANWIQDSLSNEEQPETLIVAPGTAPQVFQDLLIDLTQTRRYRDFGELSGDQETPPVTTETTGDFSVVYDVDHNWLSFEVTVVPTPTVPITVTAAHVHSATTGVPGPVVRSIDQEGILPTFVTDTLTLSGVISDFTPVEIAALLEGNFYFNVHTSVHGGGEIRGQIELSREINQPLVDEVDNEFHDGSQDPNPETGTAESNLASVPILQYQSPFAIYDGTVGLAHRDQPTLERPGTDYSGRSIYTSFGLEGMSNAFNVTYELTPTTRAELLNHFLTWLWSEPGTAVISPTEAVTTSATVIFSATMTPPANSLVAAANGAPQGIRYRWDFGDGSKLIYSASNLAGHTYICGEDNLHTVRVEIEDQYGNLAIGSQEFDASSVCFTEPPTLRDLYLPYIDQ